MSISVPTIINLTLTLANTEYSQALSSFSSKFMMQCRTLADLRVSFTAEQSGTTYFTIPAGSSFKENGTFVGVLTVYVQSPSAGVVVEFLEWR